MRTFKQIQKHIEKKIIERLDRTEAWARQNYEGPPEGLQAFVDIARDETLNAIAAAVRQACPVYVKQNSLMVSNQN